LILPTIFASIDSAEARYLKKGDLIAVEDYEGNILKRRIVRMSERLAFVCTTQEYEEARKERREPLGVGWPVEDVEDRENLKLK
jgi:hypothetical protein